MYIGRLKTEKYLIQTNSCSETPPHTFQNDILSD